MHCRYIGFVMKILLLHWGNISIDIQILGNLVSVCMKSRIIIWEKQALSCRMHVLVMEDAVCRTRRMRWTSCIHSMYSLYKGCSQETNISVSYSCDGCCTRLWTLCNLYAMCCGLTRQYLPKVMYTVCATLHVWAMENPQVIRHSSFQHIFGVNVWARIIDDCVIGPYVIEDHFSGVHCTSFLEEIVQRLLEDMPLHVRKSKWFQRISIPPHFACWVHSWLDNFWTDGSLIAWPPHFHRFLLVRLLEGKVYAMEVQDHDVLISCIDVGAESCVDNWLPLGSVWLLCQHVFRRREDT